MEDLNLVQTFLRWLIRLDDPLDEQGAADRKTVTLRKIIDEARLVEPLVAALLNAAPEPNAWRFGVTVPLDVPAEARDRLAAAVIDAVHAWQPADRVGWDPFVAGHPLYDGLAGSAARDPERPLPEGELPQAVDDASTCGDDGVRHGPAEFGVGPDEPGPRLPANPKPSITASEVDRP